MGPQWTTKGGVRPSAWYKTGTKAAARFWVLNLGIELMLSRLAAHCKSRGNIVDFVEVEVSKWDRFNARKDVTRNWWFKLSNTLIEDPDFLSFSGDEFRAWIYILSQASKSGKAFVRIHFEHANKFNITPESMASAIEKLELVRCVTVTRKVRGRTANVSAEERRGEEKREEGTVVQIPNVLQSKPLAAPSAAALYSPKDPKELVGAVGEFTLSTWKKLYSDEDFLHRETIKAFHYYENNPRKKPKTIRGWRSALSSWFERGWPRHVRTLPSQPSASAGQGV